LVFSPDFIVEVILLIITSYIFTYDLKKHLLTQKVTLFQLWRIIT